MQSKKLRFKAFVLFSAVFFGLQSANTFANNTSLEDVKKKKIFGFSAKLKTTSNLYQIGDVDHNASQEFWAIPSIKLNDDLKLSLLMIASKGLTGKRESKLLLTRFSLGLKPIKFSKVASWAPSVRLPIGLGKEKSEKESLLFGVSLASQIKLNFDTVGGKGLSAFYLPIGTVYNHEFDTNVSGKSNTQYSLTNWFHVAYEMLEGISISSGVIMTTAWTYFGTQKNSFEIYQELSYDLNKAFSFTFGHTNAGNALAANGQDSNVSFFDENSSTVYAELNYSY